MANNAYQYTTSPRKLNPDYEKPKVKKENKKRLKVVENLPRQEIKLSKKQKEKRRKLMFYVIAIFIVLLAISYRNSQINERFNKVKTLKKELSSIEKENEQLKVNIENSLNLSNIEQQAKEKLGMQKLSSNQTIYINLPKKDYVETAPEKVIVQEEKNWFEKFIDKIFNR